MADIPVNASPAFVLVDVTTDGQTDFDFNFLAMAVGDLRAIYTSPAGVQTALVPTTDFTASGLEVATGGTISLIALVTEAGGTVLIYRENEIARPNDYQVDLFAATINREMDKIFQILQEQARDISRAVKVPVGAVPISIDPNIPNNRTLMRLGSRLVAGPDIEAVAADVLQRATDEADRSETAREGSEAAEARAASYANTAVQGGTGNNYGVVAGLPAIDIPVGVTTFFATGYAEEGDAGGPITFVEATEDGSPLLKGQVQTNSGTRRWEYTAARFGPVPAAAFGSFTGTALQDANDYMSRNGGGEIYLPSGSASVISETVALSLGVTLKGGKGSSLQPGAVMDSMISTEHGLTKVEGIKIENVASRAARAIKVDKTGDNLSVEIKDNYITNFPTAIDWIDGDCLVMERNTMFFNGVALQSLNDCRNAEIISNYITFGNGLLFQKDTQGAEGVRVVSNAILPALPNAFGIQINHMLECEIVANIIDQIVAGGYAVGVDASIHGDGSITAVKLVSNWLGRQGGAPDANFGLYMNGPIRHLTSAHNTYVGFQEAGIYGNGNTGILLNFQSHSDTFWEADQCLRDIQLTNAQQVLIDGAWFSGAASIVEGANVTGRVQNCSFINSRPPIDLGLKYGTQKAGMNLRSKGIVNIPDGLVGIFEHGLDYIPSVADIRLTLASFSPNGTGDLVVPVANINASTITVSPRISVGGAVDVGWEVDMTR